MPAPKTKPQKASQRNTAEGSRRERSRITRTTELSEQVLEQVETGQHRAIEAVRKFMASADRALPPRADGPSRREELIDSALVMTERLGKAQYDFVRNVVHSAGESLGGSNGSR
jgi:hypothetical protein